MSDIPPHCLIVRSQLPYDPRATGLRAATRALGLTLVTHLELQNLFFIEGELSPTDRRRLAAELLSDPIAQAYEWRSVGNDGVIRFSGDVAVMPVRDLNDDQLLAVSRASRG